MAFGDLYLVSTGGNASGATACKLVKLLAAGSDVYSLVNVAGYDAGGTVVPVDATHGLPVTVVTGIVPGVAATSLGKAEDAAHTTGDTGVGCLMVVETTEGGTSATDGDYAFPTLNSTGAQRVQATLHTTGGASIHRDTDIDETESTVKASAGMVYGGQLWNVSTTAAHFVHFYDAAAPDTSADTPTASFMIPKGASGIPGVLNLSEALAGCPIPFATAITVGALTTMAPGATGPGASEVQGTILYK